MIDLNSGKCLTCGTTAIVTRSGLVCRKLGCGGVHAMSAFERSHFLAKHPECGPAKLPPKPRKQPLEKEAKR